MHLEEKQHDDTILPLLIAFGLLLFFILKVSSKASSFFIWKKPFESTCSDMLTYAERMQIHPWHFSEQICSNDLAFDTNVAKCAVLNTVIMIILCLYYRPVPSAHHISTVWNWLWTTFCAVCDRTAVRIRTDQLE